MKPDCTRSVASNFRAAVRALTSSGGLFVFLGSLGKLQMAFHDLPRLRAISGADSAINLPVFLRRILQIPGEFRRLAPLVIQRDRDRFINAARMGLPDAWAMAR